MEKITLYKPVNKIRIVTAASLFDGHDAAINLMRRIIQASGVEVIHLGHNRSVAEIVECAIQEDAQAVALEAEVPVAVLAVVLVAVASQVVVLVAVGRNQFPEETNS